jgi:hypothetical protein
METCSYGGVLPVHRAWEERHYRNAGRGASLLILLGVLQCTLTEVARFQDAKRRNWCDFYEDESKRSAIAQQVVIRTQSPNASWHSGPQVSWQFSFTPSQDSKSSDSSVRACCCSSSRMSFGMFWWPIKHATTLRLARLPAD